MHKNSSPHTAAALQALFVTFLWSTSWVLIKVGLREMPALTFAGMRYTLAFLCLLPFLLRPAYSASLRSLTGRDWARLAALGLLYYTVTQGAQFVGLDLLPAVTVSLLLNFTPIVVALMAIPLLGERPTRLQWGGVLLYLVGIGVYFYPASLLEGGQLVGLAVMLVGVLANAGSSVLGRHVNRGGSLHPLVVTVLSMGVGSVALLAAGLATEPFPTLDSVNWLIIVWLALVNTAFAFTLWNRTLRTLSAMESSIINGTMLVQIAVLAWLFLGETLTWQEIGGMALVGVGTLVVQLRDKTSTKPVR